ncbi:MAG: ATP-binding protein [Defluviitaleaceae bacterium]|nr:ATP-binding protein [Defluviitaleaceae bacterium]
MKTETLLPGVITNKDYKGDGFVPSIINCEFCDKERLTLGFSYFSGVVWKPSGAESCSCDSGRKKYEQEQLNLATIRLAQEKEEQEYALQQRVTRVISQSGMAKKFLKCTFENYVAVDGSKKAIKTAALGYAKNFTGQTEGLFIHGEMGTGKTHIASAIANHLLNQGIAVICMNERQLLGKIKQSFESSRSFDSDSESQVLKTYETVPLLIIDDMGKEKVTQWSIATLYAIIDARYEAEKPIVITSNYNLNELVNRLTPKEKWENDSTTARAIADRLTEMTQYIEVLGESFRRRK